MILRILVIVVILAAVFYFAFLLLSVFDNKEKQLDLPGANLSEIDLDVLIFQLSEKIKLEEAKLAEGISKTEKDLELYKARLVKAEELKNKHNLK